MKKAFRQENGKGRTMERNFHFGDNKTLELEQMEEMNHVEHFCFMTKSPTFENGRKGTSQ